MIPVKAWLIGGDLEVPLNIKEHRDGKVTMSLKTPQAMIATHVRVEVEGGQRYTFGLNGSKRVEQNAIVQLEGRLTFSDA